jgi:hypothetical protein
VNLNKRIVPMGSAEAKDQYLDLEDFRSDRPRPQRDLFSADEPSSYKAADSTDIFVRP